MTLNIYGTIGLIVITLALNAVTVEGNCMAGMSKMKPIEKAGQATYKELCDNCKQKLSVVRADINNALEKGGKPLLDKIAGVLKCKDKDELAKGLLSIFQTCLAELEDGKSMCAKGTFDKFVECAKKQAKKEDVMKKAMSCCNDAGFTEIYKMADCAILETVGGLKEKSLVDKSVKEWDKAKLKCDGSVTAHKELYAELMNYMKNCGQ